MPMRTQADVLTALAPGAETYLEVGVQEGRSLAVVLAANPVLRSVVLCDTWGTVSGGSGRQSHAHIASMLSDWPGQVVFLDGDSRELLPQLQVAQVFDLVHIDGGHAYDVVASDLREGWRLCRRWLVAHDICFTEVWHAFFAFVQTLTAATVQCFFGGHGTAVVGRVSG